MSGTVNAQSFPVFEPQFGVATLDQERLFSDSKFGQRFIDEFERQAEELAEENRQIEAALEAEELELTRIRASESEEYFRPLAAAFNEKANRIRAERRQAAQDLVEFRETRQQEFFQQVGPVLLQLMREFRVAVIINRDSVVVSLPNIDLTDAAIQRVDALFAE
ncbi:MAG: OmpH family outer membrane protein [Pseudomonadota bacterium]